MINLQIWDFYCNFARGILKITHYFINFSPSTKQLQINEKKILIPGHIVAIIMFACD